MGITDDGLLNFLWDNRLNQPDEERVKTWKNSLRDERGRPNLWALDELRRCLSRLRARAGEASTEIARQRDLLALRLAALSGPSSSWTVDEITRYVTAQTDELLKEDSELRCLVEARAEAEREYEILLARSEWFTRVLEDLQAELGYQPTVFVSKTAEKQTLTIAQALAGRDDLNFDSKASFYAWAASIAFVSPRRVGQILDETKVLVEGRQGRQSDGLQETLQNLAKYLADPEAWNAKVRQQTGE